VNLGFTTPSEHEGMRIALLMMQKNEASLLGPWTRYHASLTKASSIYVFDNGSSDPKVLERLAEAERGGIQVIRSYNRPIDYLNAGDIFSAFIKHLDTTNPHDFYFPMDCDEFLACETKSGPSCQSSDLIEQLKPFLGSQQALHIPFKYYNSPYQRNRYAKIDSCPKYFFAQGSCQSLSHGFHHATTTAGSGQLTTPITYFEFHYKPYQQHRALAAQKLEHLIGDLSDRRALAEYARKRKTNHHCATELLNSELEYFNSFKAKHNIHIDTCILDRFAELNIDASNLFSSSPLSSKRRAISLLADHLKAKLFDSVESNRDQLRALASKTKRMINR